MIVVADTKLNVEAIIKDFPILEQQVNGKRLAYLIQQQQVKTKASD